MRASPPVTRHRKTSIDESDFKVIGPLRPIAKAKARRIFENEGLDIASQYAYCRSGGENGRVRCFHLVRSSDRKRVGFLALNKTLEDHSSTVVAFVAIEFVYLCVMLRGHGFSKLLHPPVVRCVSDWLLRQQTKLRRAENTLRVYSVSNIKTDVGELFVRRFNSILRRECKAMNLPFATAE